MADDPIGDLVQEIAALDAELGRREDGHYCICSCLCFCAMVEKRMPDLGCVELCSAAKAAT